MKGRLISLLLFFSVLAFSQEIVSFSVHSGNTSRIDCPVSISMERFNYNEDRGLLSLFEIIGGNEVPVPCQLEPGFSPRLWFILSGETPMSKSRNYVLRLQENGSESGPVQFAGPIQLNKEQGILKLNHRDRPILGYQFETVYPPEGVDELFKRSGFIHPLWSPDGQTIAYLLNFMDSNDINLYTFLELFVMNADGSNPRSLAKFETNATGLWSGQNDISLCWSPDGSKIAFNKKEEGNLISHIYIINPDGSGLTQVTFAEGVTDRSVSWSN